MSKHPLTFNFARFAIFFATFLGLMAITSLRAQVTVDLSINRTIYVAYEPLLATVRITNLSGSKLLLADVQGKKWVGFQVETLDGRPVPPSDPNYEIAPIEIAPGDSITRTINLTQLYPIGDLGSYRIRASIYAAELSSYFSSPPLPVEITEGRLIWEQTVGMPGFRTVPLLAEASGAITNINSEEGLEPSLVIVTKDEDRCTNSFPLGSQIICTNGALVSSGDCLATIQKPLTRTISLMTHRFNDRTDLYLRIQDKTAGIIYCTHRLGDCISFGKPEIQLDTENTIHVLQNNKPREFIYSKIGLDGKILKRLTYSAPKDRPQLARAADGSVSVLGGIPYDPKASPTPTVIPKLSDRPVSFNEPIPSLAPDKPDSKASKKAPTKASPSPTVKSRTATNAPAIPSSQID